MAVRLAEARRAIGVQLHADSPESLASLRVAAGLSQAQLAQKIGSSQSHIACIELGRTDPGTDVIERIAAALSAQGERIYRAIRAKRSTSEAQG
jgi:transcriptional regulator with XRE-family HTH domain